MVATRNITDLNVLVTPDVDDIMLIVEKLSATSTEAKQITWGNVQEALQDIVASQLTDSATVDFTYDDVNGTLTAAVLNNTSTQKSIFTDGTTSSTRQEAIFIDGPGVNVVVADQILNDRASITINNTGVVNAATASVSGNAFTFLNSVNTDNDGTKSINFKALKLGSSILSASSTDGGNSLTLDIDASQININNLDSSNPLAVNLGGTGATAANIARNNLGAAKSGANSDISSLSGLSTALSIGQGGTGDSTASGALANLQGLSSAVGVGSSGEQVVFQSSTLVSGSYRAEFKGIKPTGQNYITVATDGSDIALGANPNNLFDGISGVRNANGARITNAGAPVNSGDLVTKAYLDAQTTGLDIKESVRAATTGNIAGSYSNGAQTLTANSNGAAVIDGETLNLNDRVLVFQQSTGTQNGIYSLTTIGDASTPFVLTRSDDFNQSSEIGAGSFTYVEAGTVNSGKSFVQTVRNPIIDTTALTFSVFGESAIGNNSISNAKLQQVSEATIKGRSPSSGTGNVSDLSADQVIAVLNSASSATINAARVTQLTANQLVSSLNNATNALDAGTY